MVGLFLRNEEFSDKIKMLLKSIRDIENITVKFIQKPK